MLIKGFLNILLSDFETYITYHHITCLFVNNSSGGVFRMEPFGGEECHSSESGWTMYIGSPIDDGGHSDDAEKNDEEGIQTNPQDDNEDDESDDSMASDASSGPSHLGINHGLADFQQDAEEEYDADKYCLEKKASKSQHKQMEGKKVEKKGMLFVDSKDKSPVQGCGKVRKNYFVEKRK